MRREVCDRHRLDLFLQNQLPEDGQRDLEAHLDFCPACRDRLDNLAGGEHLWSAVRRYLGGDGASELLQTRGEKAGRRPANIDLSFLQPSDSPASLGRLGSYEVLEVVGRGGWGIVLKAFDPALHRPVAIKVLAPEYASNGKARLRFAREAQAVAAVIHDHVVPVHAVDADATPPYLVMAFIPGQSLQQRLDHSGPLELKEILRIGMQMASGLAAAHAQGLVHRDIKPANIMLENGVERVRITDFGLARAVHDASVTQSGAVTGTPQYMAPEQADGGVVDQRADLFALGGTLYAMATGQAPFRGDSALAIMRQVCDAEPTPIRTSNPAIPVWLEGIVQKLHKKEPVQRFQSAAEVAELLESCLAHLQQPDRHPLPALAVKLGREVPGSKESRWLPRPWLAAGALVAATAGAALLFLLVGQPQEQPTVNPGRTATEPPTAAVLDLDGEDFRQGSTKLHAQLDAMQQSLSTAGPSEWADPELGVDQLNRRAEKLRRSLSAVPEPPADPVDAQLDSMRRKLEQLRQRVGGDHE